MSGSLVTFEKIGHIGKICLNRPDKYNSFVREMAMDCLAYLNTCEKDNDIRAIYLTGIGKAFCAGQDLKEALDPDNGLDLNRIVTEHYNPLARKIFNIEKPVIAGVNGVAAGAGANLALLCDIVVASESASFIQAFSSIGLIPDTGGTYSLPRLVGFQKALALTLLGEKVPAVEAERIGMIYKYFPDASFEKDAWAIVEKVSKMPTQGLALTKKAYNLGLCNSFEDQLEVERQLQVQAGNTHDYKEGTAAFVEKRKPTFIGK